ncbi:hypothetical protein B9Z19DRAFT_1079409, partial [Tuber borchii]
MTMMTMMLLMMLSTLPNSTFFSLEDDCKILLMAEPAPNSNVGCNRWKNFFSVYADPVQNASAICSAAYTMELDHPGHTQSEASGHKAVDE